MSLPRVCFLFKLQQGGAHEVLRFDAAGIQTFFKIMYFCGKALIFQDKNKNNLIRVFT